MEEDPQINKISEKDQEINLNNSEEISKAEKNSKTLDKDRDSLSLISNLVKSNNK